MEFVPRNSPWLYRHHHHRVSSNVVFHIQRLGVMTDKEKIRAEIERLYNQSLADENRQAGRGLEGAASVSYGKSKACKELLSFIDSIQEEPTTSVQNEDIEQYARNEADKFASKEYEYHNDIGLLKKGFYWGCKAGANWQEQQMINKGAEWLRDCLDNGLWVDQFLSEKEKEAVVLTYKENMEEEIKLWKK